MVSRWESSIFFFTTVCRWWIASSFQLESMPSYCSKDMSYNEIPSLQDSVDSSFGGSVALDQVKLLQVQAIIRHGARVPFAKPICWTGYDYTWDCNVYEEAGSSYLDADGNEVAYGPFRKVYDARVDVNALEGTCAMGQLLEEGFEQEMANGRHLRDAYVCDGSHCLFNDGSAAELQKNNSLYLRSDDSQRTIMSGLILTENMLEVGDGVKLDIHTADYLYDYLSASSTGCPALRALSQAAFDSAEWNEYDASDEVQTMFQDLEDVWGVEPNSAYVLDCLMTTACTGKELPEGMSEDLFNHAVDYFTHYMVFQSSYDNGSYAKLGISKLVSDMRSYFTGAMDRSSPIKFFLVSGHDSTFFPLWSAIAPDLWDKQWPAYASLASLELFQIEGGLVGSGSDDDESEYFFRLVYNGEVLHIEGCEEKDICPASKFLDATQFAEDLEGQCEVQDSSEDSTSSSVITSPSSSPAPTALNGSDSGTGADGGDLSTSEAAKGSTAESGSSSAAGAGDHPGSEANANAFGVAVTCFLIGGLVVAVPAAMYFRRFRYEAMRDTGHRDDYGW